MPPAIEAPRLKVDLPYLHAFKSRHGKVLTYYRRGGQRIRIPGDVGSAEWLAAYQRIHAQFERPDAAPAIEGTWRALIATYRAAPEFLTLGERTRADYARHLDRILEVNGDKAVATLTRPQLLAIRDKVAAKRGARQADYHVAVYGLLLTFAVDRGVRKDHPGQRIKKVYRALGHRPWRDDEIAAYRKRWPHGTWERTAFEILLNVAQRAGDVSRMTWPQVRAGVVSLRQGKTGAWLEIPQTRELAAALAAWEAALRDENRLAVAILVGDRKKPVGRDRFNHRLADAFAEAGLDGVTIHGLRYTTATILRELGVDLDIRRAVLGHSTVAMAEKYSAQKRGAAAAVARLDEAAASD